MAYSLRNLGFAAFLVVSTSCSNGAQETRDVKIRPAKLTTVEVASSERDLTFPAVVRAARSAELTFQVNGEIRELNVLEGAEITKNDIIAQLDQRNAQNALAQAKAEYTNAQAEYERAERLVAQDAISQSALDARRTQRDIARVSLSTAEKALNDTVLRAPFSGSISRVFVEQFQNVQLKEPIAVLQSDEIEAIVNVPGTIIARIPQLEPVGTRVILDAAPDVEIPATFRESSGLADENTQTYQISFTFEPPADLLILPGMTATIRTTFVFKGAKDILPEGVAAPLSSILAEGNQTYVWVVDDESMTISKQPVTVGPDAGDMVTVVNGLEGGETIVAAGVSFFHEGMQVRAWTPE